jgi:hypothetical protein
MLALRVGSINQLMTLLFALAGVAVLFTGLRNALAYGLLWLFTKSFWVRLAFHFDTASGRELTDWMGPAPALYLALLCIIAMGQPGFLDRVGSGPRPLRWLLALGALSLLWLLLPAGQIWVKLAGFQRNVFPTMAVAFLALTVISRPEHYRRLCRVLLSFAIVSVAYAILQYLLALPSWERSWFDHILATRSQGLSGWLTIGFSGLEFRVYSCYYGYTEFFFSTVGIILASLGCAYHFDDRTARRMWFALVSLFVVLIVLTLERMPALMLLFGLLTAWSLTADRRTFRRRVAGSMTVLLLLWGLMRLTLPVFLLSDVDKLVRLAELSNPLTATSIQDRISHEWRDAVNAIAARPWGSGLGYGSQTRAKAEAQRTGTLVAPHNEVLQKSLELGLLGGVLLIGLLVSQWRFVQQRLFGGGLPHTIRGVLLGYAAMLIAFVACGMVNLSFSGTMGVLFWLFTGITWGLTHEQREMYRGMSGDHAR